MIELVNHSGGSDGKGGKLLLLSSGGIYVLGTSLFAEEGKDKWFVGQQTRKRMPCSYDITISNRLQHKCQ